MRGKGRRHWVYKIEKQAPIGGEEWQRKNERDQQAGHVAARLQIQLFQAEAGGW